MNVGVVWQSLNQVGRIARAASMGIERASRPCLALYRAVVGRDDVLMGARHAIGSSST